MASATDLFRAHIERFNQGVRTGSFDTMVEGFSDDAEMAFVGVPVGPFLGRTAIAEAYRSQPPTDELSVLELMSEEDDAVVARYAWNQAPAVQAGRMECRFDSGMIQRLVVSFESA